MGNKRSSGSFCSLVVATLSGLSDSVAALPVAALGDGAECYCVFNSAVYRYSASSTQTTLGSVFIQPTVGGGCWAKQNAGSNYACNVQLSATGFGVSMTSNNLWQAFPAATGNYQQTVAATGIWLLSPAFGTLTYSGPTGIHAVISMQVSLNTQSAVGSFIDMDLSVNGSLIGTSTSTTSLVVQSVDVSGSTMQFSHVAQILLTNGATYQHVMQAPSGKIQTFLAYQASVIAFP